MSNTAKQPAKKTISRREATERKLVNAYAMADQKQKAAERLKNKAKEDLLALWAKRGSEEGHLVHGTRHTVRFSTGCRTSYNMKQAIEDHGEDFFEDYLKSTNYTLVKITNKKDV